MTRGQIVEELKRGESENGVMRKWPSDRAASARRKIFTQLPSCLAGLEFDEVFIFDFFADSPADEKTWRVITSCLARDSPGSNLLEDSSIPIPAPRPVTFNKDAHSLLNEELKMLYTAITRARVKVTMAALPPRSHVLVPTAWISWLPKGAWPRRNLQAPCF